MWNTKLQNLTQGDISVNSRLKKENQDFELSYEMFNRTLMPIKVMTHALSHKLVTFNNVLRGKLYGKWLISEIYVFNKTARPRPFIKKHV